MHWLSADSNQPTWTSQKFVNKSSLLNKLGCQHRWRKCNFWSLLAQKVQILQNVSPKQSANLDIFPLKSANLDSYSLLKVTNRENFFHNQGKNFGGSIFTKSKLIKIGFVEMIGWWWEPKETKTHWRIYFVFLIRASVGMSNFSIIWLVIYSICGLWLLIFWVVMSLDLILFMHLTSFGWKLACTVYLIKFSINIYHFFFRHLVSQ